MQRLSQLFTSHFGYAPREIVQMAGAGSNRCYARLYAADGTSVIGVCGTSRAENHAFIYLSSHFAQHGLPVPAIIAVSSDEMVYLQSDLGHRSLYDALKPARESKEYGTGERSLIERAMRLLAHVQVKGAQGIDTTEMMKPATFDTLAAMFDLNYFKYCFFKTTDLPLDETALQDDFERFAARLQKASGGSGFLYRDFQARNIMLTEGDQPALIDYQGGRIGPLQYDVASFLWQASAGYPPELRQAMVEIYLDELQTLRNVDRTAFRADLQQFCLLRMLQVLGAYGLRGLFERKPYFLKSIPAALSNIRELIDAGSADDYPVLRDALLRLISLPQFGAKAEPCAQQHEPSTPDTQEPPTLTVNVVSFSFKKGLPADESGIGGGYIFDCRSTHNPGRYERYKQLTGMDRPVIDFLEADGEITKFLSHVFPLVDHHAERFMARKFTHLMVCFGCTGGQHRSVYCAERVAEHLNQTYGVRVELQHREQGVSRTFEARTTKNN